MQTQSPLYASPEFSDAAGDDPFGKKYGVIYADPPWRYKNWSMKERTVRGERWARRHGRSPYEVMDADDIAALPISRLASTDCALFMWATYPMLPEALQVVANWGFSYKTVAFTWVKLNPSGRGYKLGMGYWTRGNAEICLLATRGHPRRCSKRVSQLVVAPVRAHSAKPPEVRDRIIDLMGDAPRLELFARHPGVIIRCCGLTEEKKAAYPFHEKEANSRGDGRKDTPHERGYAET